MMHPGEAMNASLTDFDRTHCRLHVPPTRRLPHQHRRARSTTRVCRLDPRVSAASSASTSRLGTLARYVAVSFDAVFDLDITVHTSENSLAHCPYGDVPTRCVAEHLPQRHTRSDWM